MLTRKLITALAYVLFFATAVSSCTFSAEQRRIPNPCARRGDPPLPYADALQDALDRALRENQGAHDLGISAAVIVPGYQPWVGVSGSSHRGVPLTPEMRFNMGSIAKTFEAALALQLAEEGAFDLDQPISDFLPAYHNVDGRITIRQLLNHSSGLYNVFEHPDFPWAGSAVDYAKEWPIEEVFQRFVAAPYGPPGQVQHYASTNYLLLTAIVAQQEDVPRAITRRFLVPLALANTTISMGELPPDPDTIAHPWIDISGDGILQDLHGTPQNWIASLTHPVLYATPLDIACWTTALFHERSVLSPDALAQMMAVPRTEESDPEGGRYGLGVVDFSDVLGTPAVGHGGSALGYSAAALYLPDRGVTLAWAINTGESPQELANDLMNATWQGFEEIMKQ